MYEPYEFHDNAPNMQQTEHNAETPVKIKRTGVRLTALMMAAALAAGAAGGAVGYSLGNRPMQSPESSALLTEMRMSDDALPLATTLAEDGLNLAPANSRQLTPAEVYEQNVNAVVAVNTESSTNVWGQVSVFASRGSGFIITDDGYVLTNHHVIADGERITVTLTSGESYEAELVGGDEENDLALLKIDGENLPVASVGDSDQLQVGDQVAAIGNPLGELTNTLTVGYVSALDREINTDGTPLNMLQTDAAINSGNSGGPLFDMHGNVIGITTAKFASSSIEGLGFAIPINDAMYIVYDLLEYGYVTARPLMGVSIKDLDPVTASYYSLPVGVYIGEVAAGGAAEAAGVQTGDIIIGLGERDVNSYSDLSAALKQYRAGDTATMTVYRAGAELELQITFDEKLPEEAVEEETVQERPAGNVRNGYPSGSDGTTQ